MYINLNNPNKNDISTLMTKIQNDYEIPSIYLKRLKSMIFKCQNEEDVEEIFKEFEQVIQNYSNLYKYTGYDINRIEINENGHYIDKYEIKTPTDVKMMFSKIREIPDPYDDETVKGIQTLPTLYYEFDACRIFYATHLSIHYYLVALNKC